MSTAITIKPPADELQDLAWLALDHFVKIRRLRRHGIGALGEKCSTVQFEHHGYGAPPDWLLQWALRRLAQGIPGGALVSVCPFDKPPPDVLNEHEIAPQAAAIAISEIAAMQVLRGFHASRFIYRLAVTWTPRPPRQRRLAHTQKLN